MKILRNLVVTDRLYQAGSGDEAAIGDTVVLSLDQEYNSDFPETITGQISKLTKVSCGSETSYDIEYDETDIAGSGVTFLRSEDITDYSVLNQASMIAVDLQSEVLARAAADVVLDNAKIDADPNAVTLVLQGLEADPDRIGSEYLPEEIEGKFTLADATGSVILNGQIAGVLGKASLGDGVTLEGNLMGARITRATGSRTAVELQSASLLKILSIPVSGERLFNQTALYFQIEAVIEFSSNSFPQTPIIVMALTDYTGFTAFSTVSEINNLGVNFGFGSFPTSNSVFQVSGAMACDINFVAATPPFVTRNTYRLREKTLTSQGATLIQGTAGSGAISSLLNYGAGNPVTASKAPINPEDCNLSFYLSIPASAAETRTLKYGLTVRSEF